MATSPNSENGVNTSRRDFLKVLGVGGAAASATGCSTGDVEKLIPYLVSPDQTTPGVSNYYASTCRECAAGCGIIVEVRDGGISAEANARPYFVMEYIDGPSIIEYCNRARMTVGDRIRMFIAVCDGVQHAHARGIVHRDIKPKNIVVSTASLPTPKVIDFGVAKAIDEAIDMPDMTQLGHLVGTATYASPEQLMGVVDGIDARCAHLLR